MASNLLKSSARILGGSAIAGIGFSFGRDVYRNAKKPDTKNAIIAALIFVGAILGAYIGGVWLARNYQTIWGSTFKRIAGVIILVPSFAILLIVGSWFTGAPSASVESDVETKVEFAEIEKTPETEGSVSSASADVESPSSMFSVGSYFFPCGVLLVGLVAGGFQRSKRKTVWAAELANEQFMKDKGLIEHEDGTIEDESTGQHYRVDHVGTRRITLFPIGRRGKRAYIKIEEGGKYSEFTGIIANVI